MAKIDAAAAKGWGRAERHVSYEVGGELVLVSQLEAEGTNEAREGQGLDASVAAGWQKQRQQSGTSTRRRRLAWRTTEEEEEPLVDLRAHSVSDGPLDVQMKYGPPLSRCQPG